MWTRSVRLAAAAPLPLPLLLLLAACGPRPALAFNVLRSGALVFSPPDATYTGQYFGFSVALASTIDRKSWMIVSAPRATSHFEKSVFRNSGALFRCPPTGGSCVEMNFIQGSSDSDDDDHPMNINNSTLGGSMDGRLGNNGMVVCNPSYKVMDERILDMPGMCYWLYNITSNESKVPRRKLKSNIDARDKYSLNGETWKDEHGTPQLGFSVHQFQGKEEHLLIGGPGLFAGRGTVALFQIGETMENYGVAIPTLEDDSYFGYSVTAGIFQPGLLSYVGSAPRADDLRGKVIVFGYKNRTKYIEVSTVIIEKELNGAQIGEYFGASITVADINNDGLDELLVGAPLHSLGTGDEGKVYMYMTNIQSKTGLLEIKEEIMPKVKNPNGRFGTSITSFGDIDDDGYADVVVGAPYEDSGRGAIYIFYGSSDSPYLKHEHRIRASELGNQIKGFGFSLSRAGDVDDNTYNDLGVGAYLSDHAVMLRTSPVLRLISSVRIKNADKILMYDNKVDLIICVKPNKLLEDTGIEVTVNIDPVFNRGSISEKRRIKYNLYLTARNLGDECRELNLALKNYTKIYKPLEIDLSYKILHPVPKDGQFCKTCPILDLKNPHSYHYIHYQTGCAGQICKTNLRLKGSFTDVRSPFIIGSNNKNSIELVLEVANLLEPSYETIISISFPSAIRLRQSHQSCYNSKVNTTGITKLLCEVPYMLDKSAKPFSVNVHFDMDSVPWEINMLQVNVSVEGSGEEQNTEDDSMNLLLELQHIADISIKGRSSVENIPFAIKHNDSEDYTYLDRTFEHIYTIANNGPSPVQKLHLKFMIPYKIKDGETSITYLNVLPIAPLPIVLNAPKIEEENFPEYDIASEESRDPQYLNLDCSLPEIECYEINYVSDIIFAKRGITVSFKISSPLRELGPSIKQSGVYVRTVGTIENEFILNQDLGSQTYFIAEAETWLNGKVLSQESVQDWIIIVAVICGILILGILCVILWKLGFFKRNKPPTGEEAENEKPDTSEKVDTDPLYEENA